MDMEKITIFAARDRDGICLFDHEPEKLGDYFANNYGLHEPLYDYSEIIRPMFNDIPEGEVRKYTITITEEQ